MKEKSPFYGLMESMWLYHGLTEEEMLRNVPLFITQEECEEIMKLER